MSSPQAGCVHFDPPRQAFTLVEMLVVIVIIVALLVMIVPAVTSIKKGQEVNAAADMVSGSLALARTYALSNNTYAWVGFYEEDGFHASTNPATAGKGRIVLDLVAAAGGALPYNAAGSIDGSKLIQIDRLRKIDNAHLATFPVTINGAPIASPATTPVDPASSPSPTIGDNTPGVSNTPFTYPLSGKAQYTFVKAVQFNPRGEARINNNLDYPLQPIIEVGLQPARGGVVDPTSPNVVSVQITGIGGALTVYRR